MESSFLATYLLPFSIGIIMFNLGLSLTLEDFKQIFIFPRSLIIGLIAQIIFLPIIAFTIAFFSNFPNEIKLGIILIAACPGGATANLITYHLKGNVALSVSITSINSFIILFTIPWLIFLGTHIFFQEGTIIHLPVWITIRKIVAMVLIPTMLGVFFRHFYSEKARKLEKTMKYIALAFFAIIFIVTIFKDESNRSINTYVNIAPYVLLLNVLAMFAGFFSGYFMHLSKDKLITLSVEVGIQNSALAITLASSPLFLNNSTIALPAIIYGLITFVNAVIFGYIIQRFMK